MTHTLVLTPRNRRSAAFFWLGVGVFPVFWSWFTMTQRFPKWQRYLALGWMLVVMAAFAITWPQMSERYYLMARGLPVTCCRLSYWLCIWLLVRIFSWRDLIMLCVVMMDAIAILQSMYIPFLMRLSTRDFSPWWLLLPVVPALFHLLVEPARRLGSLLDLNKRASIEVYWVSFALLPITFIWFTIDQYFTRRQRLIAWSWTVIHTTAVALMVPSLFFLLIPLSLLMGITALRQWWLLRSKEESNDDAP